ncbi:hypothetical protein KSC_027850 [Ktedonobacter sp. SOSP1-52]|nr:hypothetical protein KSC_027850 [Ktedonobacter sp. SOSP1-52]
MLKRKSLFELEAAVVSKDLRKQGNFLYILSRGFVLLESLFSVLCDRICLIVSYSYDMVVVI